MMTNETVGESRLLKSAHALKAFFEQKLKTPLEFLGEAPASPTASDLELGAALSAHGIWGLRAPQALGDQERAEIHEMFQTILGSLQQLKSKNEDLARMEQRLNENFEELPSNVIPFRRSSLNQNLLSTPRKRWMLRLDCLIEAVSVAEVLKMAVELHAQSSRYAFIEYCELDARTRLTPSDLLGMGAITLFIPDLLDLSQYEQQVLRHIVEQDTLNRPLLMVGSTLPFSQLRLDPRVDAEFLSLLSRAYIKLTRPFAEYKNQGLIQYFLDSLSQNPS